MGCFLCSQEAEFHITQEETDIYPDFVTIARGFGVPSKRVRHPSELRAAIREMLDTPGPFLLDVMVQTVLLTSVFLCLWLYNRGQGQEHQHRLAVHRCRAPDMPTIAESCRCLTSSTCCP